MTMPTIPARVASPTRPDSIPTLSARRNCPISRNGSPRKLRPAAITIPISRMAGRQIPMVAARRVSATTTVHLVCPIGSQYSGDRNVTFAEQAGAKLIENAAVYKLEKTPDGKRLRRQTGAMFCRARGKECAGIAGVGLRRGDGPGN